MSLASLFRWVPTPGYGKCGGKNKDCSIAPVKDDMDDLFYEHDMNLYGAHQIENNFERKLAEKECDRILHDGLKKLDPSKLNWYGKIYRLGALMVFK